MSENTPISNNIKVIGISGYARAGKNTFVEIARNILTKNNYRVIRFAFADKLKAEVLGMLRQNEFKLNITNLSAEEKEKVRPLFVFWGCQRRYESEGGLYWVNEVDNQLRKIIDDAINGGESPERIVALIEDTRFPNEAKWIQEDWDGVVIHLKKWQIEYRKGGQDGSDEYFVKVYDEPPNEEEAKQDPLVENMADIKTEWESKGKSTIIDASQEPDLQKVVLDALNQTKFFRFESPVTGKLSL